MTASRHTVESPGHSSSNPPPLDAIRHSYDQIATTYARRFAGELASKPLDRALLDAFAEEVLPLGPVCDLGCGPGHVGAYLATHGLEVSGIDLSPGLLAEGRRLFPEIRFSTGNLLALPLPDGSLGGATSFYSIIHLSPEERRHSFFETRRVLLARGLLLLAFHVGDTTIRLQEWEGHAVSLDYHLLDPAEVDQELEAAGFEIEATLVREPYDGVEYPTRRAYVLARAR